MPEGPTPVSQSHGRHRVVVIDDEPENLELLSRILQPEYDCALFASGEAALAAIEAGRQVDLALVDQRMPGMSGIQFLALLKERSPQTMRLVLSAHTELGDLIDAVNRGEVYRYIVKPFKIDELRSILRQALERYELGQEHDRLLADLQRSNRELQENQAHLAKERSMREAMYRERIHSLARTVAGVAHALNTPLGVAKSACAVVRTAIKQVAADSVEPMAGEVREDLLDSCALLLRSLSRAEQVVQEFKGLAAFDMVADPIDCDLVELVQSSIHALGPALATAKIAVRVQTNGTQAFPWRGHPDSFEQIIEALIQNSIRHAYTEQGGGSLDLRLSAADHNGTKRYRIEIEDYGRGVPAEVRPRIFEPFVTSQRDRGATGLGLAVIHNVVTNMLGGTIRCESHEGKGTMFTVEIPALVPGQLPSGPTG
ncbi:MAG: hybrid sensor histidine kinase/response regulator [Deltaproteobacteria bacterium]|nr:hybrid sensor histidine kinase/response regulator [Deltaproteobacteria bacterium]